MLVSLPVYEEQWTENLGVWLGVYLLLWGDRVVSFVCSPVRDFGSVRYCPCGPGIEYDDYACPGSYS